MDTQFRLHMESPIGWIEIFGSDNFIHAIHFVDDCLRRANGSSRLAARKVNPTDILEECKLQLEEYFKGVRTSFDFPYEAEGTEFQKKVWDHVLRIPFGETKSYGDVAREIGNKNIMRAVGMANGKNPLSIVIPCHRVLGANNKLVGYGGGLERKDWLLKHEMKVSGIEHQMDIFH